MMVHACNPNTGEAEAIMMATSEKLGRPAKYRAGLDYTVISRVRISGTHVKAGWAGEPI